MKSPADMLTIQIEITNDCFNSCSNCTRYVGNHKKKFYMDWDTFRRACESLHNSGFKGITGIMGGEPTMHPDFDRMIRYYDTVVPRGFCNEPNKNEPIDNLSQYQKDYWDFAKGKKRGLWSSYGPGYVKHFELIRNVFEYQCVNDHKSNIMHQVSMLTRKELGITDYEWIKLRDNCWLQNNWSASITPKGAFFCEIAGAMDMLFDGPGGWKVESGWWKRTPKEFGDQLNWCEMCSFCLKTPYVKAHDGVDVVSPIWDKKLEELGSKKPRIIFDVDNYNPSAYLMGNSYAPYMKESDPLKRVGMNTARHLSLNKIIMVVVCCGYSHMLKETILFNKNETDGIVVVTEEDDVETQKLCKTFNIIAHISQKKNLNGADFNKGAMLNEGIQVAREHYKTDWILLSDADIVLPIGFKETWSKKILNPGTLYFAEKVDVKLEELVKIVVNPTKLRNISATTPLEDQKPWGHFQLFNVKADVLRGREKFYSEEYLSAGHVDVEFMNLWQESQRYHTGARVIHLEHCQDGFLQLS